MESGVLDSESCTLNDLESRRDVGQIENANLASGPFDNGWSSGLDQQSESSFQRQKTESDETDEKPAKRSDYNTRLFADAEALKQRVRQGITETKYDVRNFYWDTGFCQSVTRSVWFENLTLTIIALNALWISIETDNNDKDVLIDADPVFQVGEHAFCLYFFIELALRFASFRRKVDCLRDAWFIFDSALVVVMVIETWVLTVILLVDSTGSTSSGNLGDASVLRMARLLRLTRMARMARLLRAMPELMILIKGMVAALRSVVFTLCLLLILMYVFAITMVQLTEDSSVGELYFHNVPESMMSLLIYGTLLDNVGILTAKIDNFTVMAVFLLFVLLAALTVMNMLIGVLCEVVSVVASTERETMTVNYVSLKLREVMREIDENNDNEISREEFTKVLQNDAAFKTLQEVGVDVVGLVDFGLTCIYGDDGSGEHKGEAKVLSFADFMEVVLQFRGSNAATVKDIVDMRKFLHKSSEETLKRLMSLEDKLFGPAGLRRSSTHLKLGGGSPSRRRSVSESDASDLITMVAPRSPMGRRRSVSERDAKESGSLMSELPHVVPSRNSDSSYDLSTLVRNLEALLSKSRDEIDRCLERPPVPSPIVRERSKGSLRNNYLDPSQGRQDWDRQSSAESSPSAAGLKCSAPEVLTSRRFCPAEVQPPSFCVDIPGMLEENRVQNPPAVLNSDLDDSLLRNIKLLERLKITLDGLRRATSVIISNDPNDPAGEPCVTEGTTT